MSYAEEYAVVVARRDEASFFGVLCDHSLVMLQALAPSNARREMMLQLGMELGQVHGNWILLLCAGAPVAPSAKPSGFREYVTQMVRQFAKLLLALVTEDQFCTADQLVESEELTRMAQLHTRMGRLSTETLKHFRAYVRALCNLYANYYAGNALLVRMHEDDVKCQVLYKAQALGRWLDYVKHE